MSQQKSLPAWITQLAASKAIGGQIGRLIRVKLSVERADAMYKELRPFLPMILPYALWRGRKAYKAEYRKTLLEESQPKTRD